MNSTAPCLSVLVVVLGDKVHGLDPRTGARLWRTALDPLAARLGRIAVRGPDVFVLAAALYCLDAHTGELRWKTALPGTIRAGTLLLAQGLLFAGADGEAACFDASDGRLLWHEPFRGEGICNVAFALGDDIAQADIR